MDIKRKKAALEALKGLKSLPKDHSIIKEFEKEIQDDAIKIEDSKEISELEKDRENKMKANKERHLKQLASKIGKKQAKEKYDKRK